jgi:alpha-tubulin suppressor-like RCC1 family protein
VKPSKPSRRVIVLATLALPSSSLLANTAPVLSTPASPLVVQTTNAAGAAVKFLASADDAEDGWVETLATRGGVTVKSGDFFPTGDTVVELRASDSGGLSSTASFTVQVVPGPDLKLINPSGGTEGKSTEVVGWGDPQVDNYKVLQIPNGLQDVKQIDVSQTHGLALRVDGSVVAWGGPTYLNVPTDLPPVIDVAAGAHGSLALTAEGEIRIWNAIPNAVPPPPAGIGPVIDIAAGGGHYLALRADGTVVSWAESSVGNALDVPAGLSGVVAVACGLGHSLALKADGTVVAWGYNTLGEISVPAGLRGVRKIAAGLKYSLALREDGTVVGWGSFHPTVPQPLPGRLKGIKEIGAGSTFFTTLNAAGEIESHGLFFQEAPEDLRPVSALDNSAGQSFALAELPLRWEFGGWEQGSSDSVSYTIRNDGLTDLNISSLAMTGGHTSDFSLTTDAPDLVLAPGESLSFTLTFTPTTNGPRKATARITSNDTERPVWDIELIGRGINGTPVVQDVSDLSTPEETPIHITLPASDPEGDPLTYRFSNMNPPGAGIFFGVTANSVGFAPLRDFNGDVSFDYVADDGGTESEPARVSLTVTPVNDRPVLLNMPQMVRAFTRGPAPVEVHFLRPTASDAEDGALTPAITLGGHALPNPFIAGPGVYNVTVRVHDREDVEVMGSFHIHVVSAAGPALQIESPSGTALSRPANFHEWNRSGLLNGAPSDVRGAKQIALGMEHGFVLRNDGILVGWGNGSYRQLEVPSDLTDVVKVACGDYHTVAIKANGRVVQWGKGEAGGLGEITNAIDVAAGSDFTGVLKADGTVTAKGGNFYTNYGPQPNSNIKAISICDTYGLALRNDGTVSGWGINTKGRLNIPNGLNNVTAISAGRYHAMALKADGTIVTWGSGEEGQRSSSPNTVTAIAAGGYHSLVLRWQNNPFAWGTYKPGESRIPYPSNNVPPEVKTATLIAAGNGRSAAAVPVQPYVLDLGKIPIGVETSRLIHLKNAGSGNLAITSVAKRLGPNSFSGIPFQSTTTPGGQSTAVTIRVKPAGPGHISATYRVTTSDALEGHADVLVMAQGVTPYEAWANAKGLGGAASADAIPYGDGLENLIKFAFNMSTSGPDTKVLVAGTGSSGLPHVSLQGSGDHSFLQVEFVRRKNGGIDYLPEQTDSLAEGDFEPMTQLYETSPIDADWERVIYREPVDPETQPKRFARVRVRFP